MWTYSYDRQESYSNGVGREARIGYIDYNDSKKYQRYDTCEHRANSCCKSNIPQGSRSHRVVLRWIDELEFAMGWKKLEPFSSKAGLTFLVCSLI